MICGTQGSRHLIIHADTALHSTRAGMTSDTKLWRVSWRCFTFKPKVLIDITTKEHQTLRVISTLKCLQLHKSVRFALHCSGLTG
ncbi:MAG: hypothetical protein AAGK77_01170 [Pseudomonadota bacterium]